MASATTMLGLALVLTANTGRARGEINSFTRFMAGKLKEMHASGQKMVEQGKAIRDSGLSDIKTGIAAMAPVVGLVKKAMNFEDAMADVAKVANLDRASTEFKGLSKDALELSKYLNKDASEVGQLYASLLAGGTAKEELKAVAKIAGEGAIAFDMNAEATGNAFMTMKNALNISVADTKKAFDATNAITNKFGGRASEILEFMSQGGASVARTLKATAPEMEVFGRALMKSGVSASEAGTVMQRFRLGLYNNAEALKIFNKAGGGGEGMAAVFEVARKSGDPFKWFKEHKFGQYASQMALMSGNMNQLREMMQFVGDEQNYLGSASQEFENRTKTTSFQLGRLLQTLNALAIQSGGTLLSSITTIAESLAPIIEKVTKWAGENPKLVKSILIAIAAFGGLKIATGIFKMTFGTLFQTIGQSKRIWAVLSDQLINARYYFISFGQWIRGPFISGITKFGGLLKSGFLTAFSSIGKAVGAASRFLLANPIILIIAAIAAAAFIVYKNWDTIKAWFIRMWEVVKKSFKAAWDWIKNMFLNYTPQGLIIKHWDKIKEFFTDTWQKVKNIFWGFVDWVKGLGSMFFDLGKNIVSNIWEGLKTLATSPIKWLFEKVNSLVPDFFKNKNTTMKVAQTVSATMQPIAQMRMQPIPINGNGMSMPQPTMISSSRVGGTTNFAPVINLSGGATQADANIITDTMKKQFDKMYKDREARKDRLRF